MGVKDKIKFSQEKSQSVVVFTKVLPLLGEMKCKVTKSLPKASFANSKSDSSCSLYQEKIKINLTFKTFKTNVCLFLFNTSCYGHIAQNKESFIHRNIIPNEGRIERKFRRNGNAILRYFSKMLSFYLKVVRKNHSQYKY